MKHYKSICLFILATLFSYANADTNTYEEVTSEYEETLLQDHLYAKHGKKRRSTCNRSRSRKTPIGVAEILGAPPNVQYDLTIPTFPGSTTISLNRNAGFTEGNVELTPTGLKVNQAGVYLINFTVVIGLPGSLPPPSDLDIIALLALNDTVDLNNVVTIATVGTLQPNFPTVIHGNSIIHIPFGTTLSLVALTTEAPIPATVHRWNINIVKVD